MKRINSCNKYLNEIKLVKVNKILVEGLDKKDNLQMIDNLSNLKIYSLFLLGDKEIRKIIDKNTLVEKYSVFKKYPSTLDIKIKKTKFLAQLKKKDGKFLLGSNGKLIKTIDFQQEIPFIFGNFENEQFFSLKEAIDQTNFEYSKIKNLFFFKSGRWDIETNNGIIIKLPKDKVYLSLKKLINFLNQNSEKKIKAIDLRQDNQIIING